MEERYYAGLDVSKDTTAICVRRSDGAVELVCEVSTDPYAIHGVLADLEDGLVRVVLETGRMANWLHGELTRLGLPAICVDARQAHAVLSQMHNKTDANDAVLEGQDALAPIILPLLAVRTEALRQAAALTKELVRQVKASEACQRLMTVPGVGTVTAATFVATIDAPGRFAKSRSVGAYAGLTSRRHQSGAVDYGGRISKRGDRLLRTMLYEAANALLCRVKPGRGQALRDWAKALRQRTSHKKAVIALARKLAVMMHAIWVSGGVYEEREA